MSGRSLRWSAALLPVLGLLGLSTARRPFAQAPSPAEQRPVFDTRVDLVVVNATVTDSAGHFVTGLRQPDFALLEDGRPVDITAFNSDRVPVSLGIALDVSGSMKGDKMTAAREALDRLLNQLLDRNDEIFVYGFSDEPVLLQDWTTRRDVLRQALDHAPTGGLTALFDTVSQAIAHAQTGKYRKKALLVLSDGNDTASHTNLAALKRQIDASEVLVYAIGVDAQSSSDGGRRAPEVLRQVQFPGSMGDPQRPRPIPPLPPRFPQPPGTGPGGRGPQPFPPAPPRVPPPGSVAVKDAPVDAAALRAITDDSGGRTEIVRTAADLGPATTGIADELSRQYFLGYQAVRADGRWHTIDVVVRGGALRARARKGYQAAAR